MGQGEDNWEIWLFSKLERGGGNMGAALREFPGWRGAGLVTWGERGGFDSQGVGSEVAVGASWKRESVGGQEGISKHEFIHLGGKKG